MVDATSEHIKENDTNETESLPDYQPPQCPVFPIPEDLEVGGWIHLQSDLVNHVIRRIHDNPQFFTALQLQFEGQDTIFGEDIRALEGLHIVCRRLERDARERAAAAEEGAVDLWDEYFEEARHRADILQAYDNVLRRN